MKKTITIDTDKVFTAKELLEMLGVILPKEEPKKEKLYTLAEIAEHLGVSIHSVRNYVRAGKLAVTKLSQRMYRVTESEFKRFCERGIKQ